jgi:hypothetical protein
VFDLRAGVVSGQGAHRWADEMTTDIRTILDFVLEERLRFICERTGVSASGTRSEQRERVVRALGGNVRALLPLLMRAELVEFLATRDIGGGRYALVNKADRDDLQRLLTMLCVGDPRATEEKPLGEASLVRFERKVVRPLPPLPPPEPLNRQPSASEKVFRSRVQRQRGLIYYVKNGDVWAAPTRRGGSKRAPHRVHQAGVQTDNVTYLYYIDADGDIARKRRDGGPLEPGPGGHADVAARRRVRVFIGYARDDRTYLDELCEQLALYQASDEIEMYFDIGNLPGTEWEPALKAELMRTDVAIFLVSSAFFKSKYSYEVEWPLIRERHRRGECELAPVLIRACRFEKSAVGAYQVIRPDNRAVAQHDHRDTAWTEVVVALEPLFERARAKWR